MCDRLSCIPSCNPNHSNSFFIPGTRLGLYSRFHKNLQPSVCLNVLHPASDQCTQCNVNLRKLPSAHNSRVNETSVFTSAMATQMIRSASVFDYDYGR